MASITSSARRSGPSDGSDHGRSCAPAVAGKRQRREHHAAQHKPHQAPHTDRLPPQRPAVSSTVGRRVRRSSVPPDLISSPFARQAKRSWLERESSQRLHEPTGPRRRRARRRMDYDSAAVRVPVSRQMGRAEAAILGDFPMRRAAAAVRFGASSPARQKGHSRASRRPAPPLASRRAGGLSGVSEKSADVDTASHRGCPCALPPGCSAH